MKTFPAIISTCCFALPNKTAGQLAARQKRGGSIVAKDRYIRGPHESVILYFLRACA